MKGEKYTDLIRARLAETEKMLEKLTTKREIGNRFGISEREARRLISEVAKTRPVTAHSGRNGYQLTEYADDTSEAIRAYRELESRIKELEARKKPLEEYVQTH